MRLAESATVSNYKLLKPQYVGVKADLVIRPFIPFFKYVAELTHSKKIARSLCAVSCFVENAPRFARRSNLTPAVSATSLTTQISTLLSFCDLFHQLKDAVTTSEQLLDALVAEEKSLIALEVREAKGGHPNNNDTKRKIRGERAIPTSINPPF